MLGLPASTGIRKPVPKTVIYEKFATELTGNRKKSFENDISRIIVINEISSASVNICEGEKVKAIFVVIIELKSKDYNDKNIALISKLFGQNLLMILHYDVFYQFAIFQTKLLHSNWSTEENIKLRLDGLDLDNVWQSLVIQVSGVVPEKEHTLDQQIVIESEKEKLKKQIILLETKARKESQSKKKYELHERLMKYKKKLEEL